jgi:hypothetical protein
VNGKTLAAAVAGLTAAAAMAADTPKGWWDSITIKGDIRYRYEDIQDGSKTNSNATKAEDDRQRERIRVRASMEAKINDNLKAVVGLTTTEKGDPVSGNQTLTDTGSKKGVFLDLGYIDWTVLPGSLGSVKLLTGKMKNPFLNVSDLMFDGDLTPEGAALNGAFGGEMFSVAVNCGRFWVKEIKTNEPKDIMMNGAQFAFKLEPIPEIWMTVGVSKYMFDNVADTMASSLQYEGADSAFGNSTYTGDPSRVTQYLATPVATGPSNTTTSLSLATATSARYYKYDYNVTEYFAEFCMNFGIPVTLVAQFLDNSEADRDNKGSLYGILVGKAKNPNTFEIGYYMSEIEKDAAFGAWTDSDRWGGGTDGKGHKIVGKYQLMKNIQFGATYSMTDKVISDAAKTRDYDRLQLDLVMSF